MSRTRRPSAFTPVVERPMYLSGAPLPDAPPVVAKVAQAAKPFGGLVLGAVVGAVAAYFVPKALDRWIEGRESENVELEYEE